MSRLSTPVAVLASAAMLAAVGTGSYAAGTLITSKQIQDGTIKVKDLSPKARQQLKGQRGPVGATGPAGATGATGNQGQRGASAWDVITGGTTVSGIWYVGGYSPLGANEDYVGHEVSLPGTAASPLTWRTNVFLAPNARALAGAVSTSCTGTSANPTAPPGTLCVYIEYATPTVVVADYASTFSKHGFVLRTIPQSAGDTIAWGTWAYQAP